MFSKISSNKKAQVGKTVTWMVATIIIIVILFSTIFVATIGPWGSKDVTSRDRVDTLVSKSFFAYLLTEHEEGENVYELIDDEKDLDEFSGKLAWDIFDEFYIRDYKNVWFGIIPSAKYFFSPSNDYFDRRPAAADEFGIRPTIFGTGIIGVLTERVYLDEERIIEIILEKYN